MQAKEYIDNIIYNENLSESIKNYRPGTRVKVTHGSGVDSGKTGVIVPRNKIKTDGRSIPTNVDGAYKPVDWSKEVAILTDDGEYITMFKNRVMMENINEAKKDQRQKEYERRTTPETRKQISDLEDMLRNNPALKDITPEQKKALSDMQVGDLMNFTKMLKSTKGNIDNALQITVNSVEGDRSQLPDSLADYAEKKGWLEGFEMNEAKKPIASKVKEPVTAEDYEGKKFSVYNISHSWVALIPEDGEVSDKIMIPIGDFYEDYTLYDIKGKRIHTPEPTE